MAASERPRRRPADGGFVTAEAAVATLTLVFTLAVLLWGLMATAAQLACVDAARTGARAAARSEAPAQVRAVALSVAPRGAQVTVRRTDDRVHVRVRARSLGPVPLAVTLHAEATALAEDRPSGPADPAEEVPDDRRP